MSTPSCVTDLRNQPSGSAPVRNVWRPASPDSSKVRSGFIPTDEFENVGAPGTVVILRTNSGALTAAPSSKTTRPLAVAPGAVPTVSVVTSSPVTETGIDANSGASAAGLTSYTFSRYSPGGTLRRVNVPLEAALAGDTGAPATGSVVTSWMEALAGAPSELITIPDTTA